MRLLIVALALGTAAAAVGPRCPGAPAVALAQTPTSTERQGGIAYPLKPSVNGRYLVGQHNVPFMIVGDSPQALIGRVSVPDAERYMKNRARYGINALWINLLCNDGTACSPDGTTFDGIAPFLVPGDLSTPNPAYFRRADQMIELAAANGMLVLLNPIETAGWLKVLRRNGVANARSYGAFVGARYRRFANIVWMHGNDFQTWRNPADDASVHAVASGTRSVDSVHLHTIELNYVTSGSLDDSTWALTIGLDAAYTYFPTYAQLLIEYNRRRFLPTVMIEANYEFEHLPDADGGSASNLRRQSYWTMLSGATGQLYGSAFTWRFPAGWQRGLDTPGIRELSYMRKLFAARKWYDLVPDQEHAAVTSGYGELSPRGSISTDTYVTAARSLDGDLLIAYMPGARPITIDMTKLSGPVEARWYDPTSGRYHPIGGAPLANAGSRQFAPPGRNSSGDSDWVLVLERSPADKAPD
jgi:hypothetical protein